MKFNDPLILLLLLLIPVLVFVRTRRSRVSTIKFSAFDALKSSLPQRRRKSRYLLLGLRCSALFLVVLALARPLKGVSHTKVFSEGIDIMLAIDISSSMDARDMTDDPRINRLAAVTQVVEKFIEERKNDRIGIVVFARYAYTQAPLTLDHNVLIDLVERLKIVPMGGSEDGTAIGSAILTSVARLRDSKAESKVIILLTDGMNNYGEIGPESAADVAKSLGVKIYTIGAGRKGPAPYPFKVMGQWTLRNVPIDIDEESLEKIAETTGGRYYRAQNEKALGEIYDRINLMEKVEIEEEKYTDYSDLFPCFLLPALALLLVEIVLGNTVLRRLP